MRLGRPFDSAVVMYSELDHLEHRRAGVAREDRDVAEARESGPAAPGAPESPGIVNGTAAVCMPPIGKIWITSPKRYRPPSAARNDGVEMPRKANAVQL